MKVKKETEKVGLKLNIHKMKIMASGPIASWEIDGETMETMSDFIFGGSKITADGDCSHEIITGHFWSKVCDVLQFHFAFLFLTSLHTCRRCPPAETLPPPASTLH